jgi:heptosyltransferase-2/heptosyltransferase-3
MAEPLDLDAPLVVRFPALGDTVLLTVLLQALQARYGKRVHVVASGAWTPVLLQGHPAVGHLQMVTSRRAPYWLTPTQWQAARLLRRHRGPVYLCEADRYAARLVARAVPQERLIRAWDHWPGDTVHWADWWLQVARLDAPGIPGPHVDLSGVAPQPSIPLSGAMRADADAWLKSKGITDRPLVLVQPGHKKTHKRGRIATSEHEKHWPADRWAMVIRGILQQLPQAVVLVCGSPREHGLAQEIVDAAGGGSPVINGARELPLPRLIALAACAHSMVSVDTGPAHVAAAMDCPAVVLFGQFGSRRWKPRAPRSTVIALGPDMPTPGRKVMDLRPAEVLAAWRSLPPRGQGAAV